MSTYIDTLDPQKVLAFADEMREKRPKDIEQANGDVRFAIYLRLVDRAMYRRIGLSYSDLADYTWWDAYEGGSTPKEAVQDCLENDDLYGMFAEEFGDE